MKPIIRLLSKEDSEIVGNIIRTVMPEFGATGDGFAINDAEVNDMFTAYNRYRAIYFVMENEGKIVGGGGVAPLEGGEPNVCELKKMYFLPEGRGRGWGQAILSKCIHAARELGFEYCYLETFNTMNSAMKLYGKNGFEPIQKPLGSTGHFACDRFYILKL
jgi:putative acetyltransferase